MPTIYNKTKLAGDFVLMDAVQHPVRAWHVTPTTMTKTKPAVKKAAPKKTANPDLLAANRERMTKWADALDKKVAAMKEGIDQTIAKLNRIESSVAVIRSGATFMQQLEQDAPKGLQPGDYTDASKEVADELTAMGFKFWGGFSSLNYIHWDYQDRDLLCARTESDNHLDRTEFIARARVTAAELGLTPEPAKDAEWVPKSGDYVVITKHAVKHYNGQCVRVDDVLGDAHIYWGKDEKGCVEAGAAKHMYRPATPAEIQHHQASLATKEREEKLKRLVFGARVEYEGENGWKVAMDGTATGYYCITKTGHARIAWAKADELTLID